MRLVALVLAAALAAGGCALSGRNLGRYIDDQTITANVKMRMVARRPATLTRVNVDTHRGVVYLTGTVDTQETKSEAEVAAWKVDGVGQVVNDLQVREAAAPSALPDFRAVRHPLQERLRGLARVEPAGVKGPRVAYDRSGRPVATIYTVPVRELAQAGTEETLLATRGIDHVTIYPSPASPDVPEPHYHVVLWHVSRGEAAALR